MVTIAQEQDLIFSSAAMQRKQMYNTLIQALYVRLLIELTQRTSMRTVVWGQRNCCVLCVRFFFFVHVCWFCSQSCWHYLSAQMHTQAVCSRCMEDSVKQAICKSKRTWPRSRRSRTGRHPTTEGSTSWGGQQPGGEQWRVLLLLHFTVQWES